MYDMDAPGFHVVNDSVHSTLTAALKRAKELNHSHVFEQKGSYMIRKWNHERRIDQEFDQFVRSENPTDPYNEANE